MPIIIPPPLNQISLASLQSFNKPGQPYELHRQLFGVQGVR
ncbi:MAG TPA: hypothetical protein VFQ23_00730 [Anaerolineales bacterium]|nr:hypothetical protein [Anaerolineales bacterium]